MKYSACNNFKFENSILILCFLLVSLAPPLQSQYSSDFNPPSGADSTESDTESPAYFRMMTATSPDGLTWTPTGTLVTDQANVPDMIKRNDTIFLYYTGYHVSPDTNTTVVAISTDEGNHWTYKHINLLGYTSGALKRNGDPDVILNPDNSIRMFITTSHLGKKSVLCFESQDGILFNYVDVAAHSASDDIFDSNTFFFNGSWHMYAINSLNYTHWYLTSTDGVHFTVDTTYDFLDGTNGHFASNGYIDGNNYRMFSSFLPNQDLYSFSTTDGASWTFEGVRMSFGTKIGEGSYLKDPSIVQLKDGTWLMVYVTRISCESFGKQTISSCESYTWNSDGKVYSKNGMYRDTLTNNSGCDSIAVLDLTITNIDNSVTNHGSHLTANDTMGSYQWLDCNNNMMTIGGATNQDFTPNVSASSAVVISRNACLDTSACYDVTITNAMQIENQINVVPNPSNGIFKIKGVSDLTDIIITDLTGTSINFQIQGDQILINEVPGIYLIKIGNSTRKILIQ